MIGRHADELAALGVALPTATRIAQQLGIRRDPMPLNDDELAVALAEDPPRFRELLTAETSRDVAGEIPEQKNAALRLRGVRVERSGREILHGIDLDVGQGEYIAVVGVNGAGKSTLTLAMAGLLPTASGTLEIGGTDIRTLNARQVGDRVGYVFQNPEHQFVTHSVRDELAYGLRVRARSEQEIDRSVDAAMERFDLGRYRDASPFTLSHGEKRRLSVATALITEPGILFLDEPTFGQDHARAEEILRFVTELHHGGVTIVIVTHDLQLVADHADRVVVLAGGRLQRVGRVDAILRDTTLLEEAGLQTPPVLRATRSAARPEPGWDGVSSLRRIGSVR